MRIQTDFLSYTTEDDVKNFEEALALVNEHLKYNGIDSTNLAEYRTDIQSYIRRSYSQFDINEYRFNFIISYWVPDIFDIEKGDE